MLARIHAVQRLAAALAVAVVAALVQPAWIPAPTRALVSWDLGVLVYLGLAWTLVARSDAQATRDHALAQDQSGFIIFLLIVGAGCAGIVAIGFLVSTFKALSSWPRTWHLALSAVALAGAWLLIQTVFAFHYARSYYGARHREPAAPAELSFPGGREPDYLDFAYYSFVVGMTSQVSDVAIASRRMRRLTLVHGVLSFLFNIAILALAINIVAGAI